MATYFLDTSAIVKRYVAETGHVWVMGICDPAANHTIVISQATLVEAVAALCRKARYGNLSLADRNRAVALFHRDVRRSYGRVRVTTAVYMRAADLCHSHDLRAYDAIQLACGLTLRDRLAALQISLTFICADNNLMRVAVSEGLSVENPNNYP